MANADTTQLVNLLEGTFDIQGKKCTVTLTSESLKWCQAKGKNKDKVVIPVEEILSVTISTEKVKTAGDCHLQLGYIKHKKSNHLGRTTVKLCGSSDVCTKWSHSIQECINSVPARPKSSLVLVNPISGSRKGPQQYREKVAPVFSEASVKTDVIKSAKHVKEIIDSYDVTSIDSIVVVGGDGMYHLMVDALMQRMMREAGLDLNDTENDVPEASLPIGIIPCGTGNGIAVSCYGCADVETAALAVVRGGKQKLNVNCVWSGGEFMVFSSLLQGFGALADLIYDTAARRSMGIWRYPAVIGGFLLKSSVRVLDLSIEYRPPALPPAQSDLTENGSQRKGPSNPDTADVGSVREGPSKSGTASNGSEREGTSKPDTTEDGSEREGPSKPDTAGEGREREGPSKPDTTDNGSKREGPSKPDTTEDGSEREGPSKPDTAGEGSEREGPSKPDTAEEGSEREGPSKPDTVEDGSEREGPSKPNTTEDGSEREVPSKPNTTESGSEREGASKSDTAEDGSERVGPSKTIETYSQPWQTYNGRGVTLGVFLSDATGYRSSRNPAYLNCARVYVMKQWGRWRYFKFMLHLLTYNPAMLHDENVDNMPFVEYKIKLNNPEEQGGHTNLINIDGEVYHLRKPEFHVKLFPGKLNLFASVTKEFLLEGIL